MKIGKSWALRSSPSLLYEEQNREIIQIIEYPKELRRSIVSKLFISRMEYFFTLPAPGRPLNLFMGMRGAQGFFEGQPSESLVT